MVRLRVVLRKWKCALETNFNSNMVRLREYYGQLPYIPLNNFNSNMVRLRADVHHSYNSRNLIFQFQYGAIKSMCTNIVRINYSRFQFQYGAIKSISKWIKYKLQKLFQFQYGAIKSSENILFRPDKKNFNSNMVRLRAQYLTALVFY